MKKRILLSFFLTIITVFYVAAQQQEAFKPNGKPEVRIFTNYTSVFSDGNTFNKFEVNRAYFGYIYNFSKSWTGRVTYDVGKPSVGNFHYTGFIKFAYLQYHTDKLAITGGMIPTPQYDLGDRKWGYRYIFKTSHDEYGFGPSADLGLSAVYKFSDIISADAILVNGESFRSIEADSTFKAGIGITITPVKNFLVRGYYDTMSKDDKNQQTFESIISYENKKVNISASYNHHQNRGLVSGQDITGLSLNGTLVLKNSSKLFARYDHVYSEKIGNAANPWNFSKDGSLIIAGIEFSPVAGIKLAPNFQGWKPADENKPFISRISLHAEIRL